MNKYQLTNDELRARELRAKLYAAAGKRRWHDNAKSILAFIVLFAVLPTLLYVALIWGRAGFEWQGVYNARQDERTYQRILDYREGK
jgi:hypothetical protein